MAVKFTMMEHIDQSMTSPKINVSPPPSYNSPETQWKIEDRLLEFFCNDEGQISITKFLNKISETGLREGDPLLEKCIRELKSFETEENLAEDKEKLNLYISENIDLISKIFTKQLIIPNFKDFSVILDEIHRNCADNEYGEIPHEMELISRQDPSKWAYSICTVDGQRHSSEPPGHDKFCLLSIVKPLLYAIVHSSLGAEETHRYVGKEPSDEMADAISLDRQHRPHNPLEDAGAIVITSLLEPKLRKADRYEHVKNRIQSFGGGEAVEYNRATSIFIKDGEGGDIHKSLGYFLRKNQCFPEDTALDATLDFYMDVRSLAINTETGSVIAATLANGGVCPITDEAVVTPEAVRDTLSLMYSCGMYNYSGKFAFSVGLPAKSSMSGAILLVVPNVMGVCLWSPLLDEHGNSCRGVQFCKELVAKFNFHNFDNIKHSKSATKTDPRLRAADVISADVVSLLFSAYHGDITALQRYYLGGSDMNLVDYDGRSALHLAVAEGHETVVNFLLCTCAVNPFLRDRWNETATMQARRLRMWRIADLLDAYMTYYHDNNNDGKGFRGIESHQTTTVHTVSCVDHKAESHHSEKCTI